MSNFSTPSVNVFLKLNQTTSCMFCVSWGVGWFFLFFFFHEKFDFCLALDSHLTRQSRELYCVICAMLGYTRSVPLAVL